MSDSVKDMLSTDINLKQELNQQFELIALRQEKIAEKQTKIGRKQNIVMVIILLCIIAVLVSGMLYYDRTRDLFFNAMKKEMMELDLKRDSVRFEKELFYRATKQPNKVFVMPIRDTIKINGK